MSSRYAVNYRPILGRTHLSSVRVKTEHPLFQSLVFSVFNFRTFRMILNDPMFAKETRWCPYLHHGHIWQLRRLPSEDPVGIIMIEEYLC